LSAASRSPSKSEASNSFSEAICPIFHAVEQNALKGGKQKVLSMHDKLEELLDQYLKATGIEKEPYRHMLETSSRR
jgi:hypothetical protein